MCTEEEGIYGRGHSQCQGPRTGVCQKLDTKLRETKGLH
jgi:hypothetical protein